MKKLTYIVFVFVFLVLFGCGRDIKTSIDDKSIDINEKIMVIQQKLINGEITQEQAQEMTQNIGNYSMDDISDTKIFVKSIKIAGLPDRAKNLGLTEPLGMILDQDISKITSVNNDIVFVFVFLVLFGCGRDIKTSIDDKSIDINEKIMVIQQKLINGEITQEQAQEMTQNIGNYSMDDISNAKFFLKSVKIVGLPDRAKNLGLTEPLGMSLDQDISKITSVNNDIEGFDSVILVYKGDYLKSIEQAAKIAQLASIPVSKEFQQAKEIEKNSPDIVNQMGDDIKNSMKGIVYSNNDLTDTNVEYLISISVDQDGTLTINVSNYKQMKQAMKNNK